MLRWAIIGLFLVVAIVATVVLTRTLVQPVRVTSPDEPTYKNVPLSTWIRQTRDADPNTRYDAIETLAEFGKASPVAVGELDRLVAAGNSGDALVAAGALHRIDPLDKSDAAVIPRVIRAGQPPSERESLLRLIRLDPLCLDTINKTYEALPPADRSNYEDLILRLRREVNMPDWDKPKRPPA